MTYRFSYPLAALAVVLVSACASTPPASDFPAGVRTPTKAEVANAVKGKSFNFATGNIRTDYGAASNDVTAYFSGRSEKGTWRAEDGRICFEFKTIASTCNEVRLLGSDIYLKRDNGQVTQLVPRT
ncbi:hypothetical protein FVQ98_06930 [Ottowia sp. GY511]|uniref:Uncharacterized protein n=1 Tax=Ottowia flava TaxID=2675430 RepID=A0ABW4KW76_9BURK|nr:hypothetical protein [Ottowia sp. GY511]TXK31018.1 hypothetical protein FVQ98_06930 [Ottowia sp. GY511]